MSWLEAHFSSSMIIQRLSLLTYLLEPSNDASSKAISSLNKVKAWRLWNCFGMNQTWFCKGTKMPVKHSQQDVENKETRFSLPLGNGWYTHANVVGEYLDDRLWEDLRDDSWCPVRQQGRWLPHRARLSHWSAFQPHSSSSKTIKWMTSFPLRSRGYIGH